MLSKVKISTPEADGQGNVTYRKDGQLNGYNGSGQRVSREDFIWNDKDNDGQIDVTGDDLTDERENEYETKFYYTGSAILYTANANNYLLTENILDPGGKIIASARFDFGNPDEPDDYFFYNYDKRGSTTAILQPDGTLKTGYEYDEFGNLEQSGDAGFLNDMTFTGSVVDMSTGLQYMNARYYNPKTGRFLSQDTYSGNPYDPWTQHLYSYCGNNPTNFIDPTGHFFYAMVDGVLTQQSSVPADYVPAPEPTPNVTTYPGQDTGEIIDAILQLTDLGMDAYGILDMRGKTIDEIMEAAQKGKTLSTVFFLAGLYRFQDGAFSRQEALTSNLWNIGVDQYLTKSGPSKRGPYELYLMANYKIDGEFRKTADSFYEYANLQSNGTLSGNNIGYGNKCELYYHDLSQEQKDYLKDNILKLHFGGMNWNEAVMPKIGGVLYDAIKLVYSPF